MAWLSGPVLVAMNELSRKEGSQVSRRKDCLSNHSLGWWSDITMWYGHTLGTYLRGWKEMGHWTGNLWRMHAAGCLMSLWAVQGLAGYVRTWQAQILGHVVVEPRVALPACPHRMEGNWWIIARHNMIWGSRFETGVYETAFSHMLPVSCAGTDGAGESQVMAQRKIA